MKTCLLVLALCMIACWPAKASAQALSGNVTWGGWNFTWAVENNAAVSIKYASFNGVTYIHSASMPVIRVQYDSTCGPYMDRITTSNINKTAANEYVRVDTISSTELRVWVDATISSYRLIQYWIFNTAGYIDTRLYSSGLQCQINHRHHPYWRIDADVAGAGDDQIRVRRKDGTFLYYGSEFNRNKLVSPEIDYWIITDKTNQRHLVIQPGVADGAADAFASYDFYGRKWGWEHIPWASNVSGYADQGDLVLGSNNGEAIDGVDVVGWYVAHLAHAASSGPTQWFYVGPRLWAL